MKHLDKVIYKKYQQAISILYPVRCPVCDKPIGGYKLACCANCQRKLPFIGNCRCFRCGKPVVSEETEYCLDCFGKTHSYTQNIALWSYDHSVRKAVYRFKYQNRREYAAYFAEELVRRHHRQIRSWNAQVLLPVPVHRSRYKKRGFNQAELLARELAVYLKLPVDTDTVLRVKNTKPQKELNDKERQKNLKSAFKINKNGIKLKKVIIIDDIYTTGTTIDAMAELLLQSGAAEVYSITICIGKGY